MIHTLHIWLNHYSGFTVPWSCSIFAFKVPHVLDYFSFLTTPTSRVNNSVIFDGHCFSSKSPTNCDLSVHTNKSGSRQMHLLLWDILSQSPHHAVAIRATCLLACRTGHLLSQGPEFHSLSFLKFHLLLSYAGSTMCLKNPYFPLHARFALGTSFKVRRLCVSWYL